MKNKFKFRAWHKLNKQYYYDAEQTYDYLLGNPPILENNFGELLQNDDYIVEQCTGVKDKNGKLIYEGDIVFIECEEDNAVIEWENDCAAFSIGTKDICWSFDNFCSYELEVIGNIHENPELLKE